MHKLEKSRRFVFYSSRHNGERRDSGIDIEDLSGFDFSFRFSLKKEKLKKEKKDLDKSRKSVNFEFCSSGH